MRSLSIIKSTATALICITSLTYEAIAIDGKKDDNNNNMHTNRDEMIHNDREARKKIKGRSVQIQDKGKEKIKVLLKLKKKAQRKNQEKVEALLADGNSSMSIDRLGIYATYLTYEEIQDIQEDADFIEPDGDAFILGDPVREMKNNIRRLEEESVPWGIDAVLQDRIFWDFLPTPEKILKICVADTGYDLGHDDLPFEEADVTGVNNPSITEEWSFDGNGHGSHVAGTIAALGGNNIGVMGVIPNSKHGMLQLLIAKAFSSEGQGSESTVVKAVEACVTQGANIISLSLGSWTYNKISAAYYQDLYDQGILVIAASGNSGDTDFMYPAGYTTVMGVAAVNDNLKRGSFSQYNSQVEISAPGVDIKSTWKDNGYIQKSGTSMATPHVAAVAGLLWMHFPTCTSYQIRNVIAETALRLEEGPSSGDEVCDDKTGYGLVQAIDAHTVLSQGDCGGYFTSASSKGGCEQLGTHSKPCTSNSDCDDNDPCTVNTCGNDKSNTNVCVSQLDCSQCGMADIVQFDITPDLYPKEATWVITRENDFEILMSGGPYPEVKPYSSSQCFDVGTYTFIIYDDYGDGICCDDGRNGSYDLTVGGSIIKSGGEFEHSEQVIFYVTAAAPIAPIALAPTKSPTNKPKKKSKNKPTNKPKSSKPTTKSIKKGNKNTNKPTKKPQKSANAPNRMQNIRKKAIKKAKKKAKKKRRNANDTNKRKRKKEQKNNEDLRQNIRKKAIKKAKKKAKKKRRNANDTNKRNRKKEQKNNEDLRKETNKVSKGIVKKRLKNRITKRRNRNDKNEE